MEAMKASYGESSSGSDSESVLTTSSDPTQLPISLPPPPLSLLHPPNSLGTIDYLAQSDQPNRVRSFPHMEGNFALHVYIPVIIPLTQRQVMALFLERVARLVPKLHVADVDIPSRNLIKDEQKFVEVVLGRFWIDFTKWVVFVYDVCTRTFLSLEVTAGGLTEIKKQIEAVNDVYRLHNLPEFYKDPRPHMSIAWAVGDNRESVIGEETKMHNTLVTFGSWYKTNNRMISNIFE